MAPSYPLKHSEYKAFAISVAIHILIFLWILFFADTASDQPLQVALVIEQQNPPIEALREKPEPVAKQRRRHSRKREAHRAELSRVPAKSSKDTLPRTLSDPWSQYEQRMFAQNRNKPSIPTTGSEARRTTWGEEKTGRVAKQGENEQVNVPAGSSSSSTRWRKGAARRLISLPPIDYPESVRRKSGQGVVELLIEVDERGHVESVEIVKSSGITRLDINARNAYRNAVFSPSASGESATGIVTVTFRMKDN